MAEMTSLEPIEVGEALCVDTFVAGDSSGVVVTGYISVNKGPVQSFPGVQDGDGLWYVRFPETIFTAPGSYAGDIDIVKVDAPWSPKCERFSGRINSRTRT